MSAALEDDIVAALTEHVALRTLPLADTLHAPNIRVLEDACWTLYRAGRVDNIRGYWCLAVTS